MATEVTKPSQTAVSRPGDVFSAMRDEMDRMFERFERGWPRLPSLISRGLGRETMLPDVDVHENGKQITVEVDLPGVEEKDVSVTMANGMLTIKGEKKSGHEEKQESYYMAERSYGSFERSLRLPDTIDENKVEARFEKGVLKITAQKKPEAVKAEKRIEIRKA
ncbi:MAG: Hsp20/alpha crystallin family protein [Hyphomicrobiaceae bacterium]|nr:Hsp20/alpha crystallin family protein [Hyphomicrobiaceae bacterium]